MKNKKAFTLIELLVVIAIVGIIGAVALPLAGCDLSNKVTPQSDTLIQEQQEASMREAVAQTGLPAIKNYQEKKMLKMLYELRDQEDLVCYAYLYNPVKGSIGQFLGKCIGYGLPASTQYSNPEKIVVNDRSGTYGSLYGTLPQAEPNGLFMPEGLSATWLMMIDDEGIPRPVYIEPAIIVSPFPLEGTSKFEVDVWTHE